METNLQLYKSIIILEKYAMDDVERDNYKKFEMNKWGELNGSGGKSIWLVTWRYYGRSNLNEVGVNLNQVGLFLTWMKYNVMRREFVKW